MTHIFATKCPVANRKAQHLLSHFKFASQQLCATIFLYATKRNDSIETIRMENIRQQVFDFAELVLFQG